MRSLVGTVCLLALFLASPLTARDLTVGDRLPDLSKVPLAALADEHRPRAYGNPSPEDLLLPDGVLIAHFSAPRPSRRGTFKLFFTEELSALRKAALSVPYPCRAVLVVPFGEKGREDARTLLDLAAKERTLPWGGGVGIYWEPTWPRPGYYLTLRPDDEALTTPYTWLIGPDRTVLAVRGPNSELPLYDWLQANLPERLKVAAGRPRVQIDPPPAGAGTWPVFRRAPGGLAAAGRAPDTLPYLYLAWRRKIGPTFASPAVADGLVYAAAHKQGLHSLRLDSGEPLERFAVGGALWSSPAVAGDLVYTASAAGVLAAVERDGLKKRWQRPLDGLITSSPTVRAGVLYVGSRNGAVYAVDAATGQVLWSYQTGGEISASPVLAGPLVLIGSGDRRLYALDAASGERKWSAETGGAVDSSAVVAGETVLVGSFDGGLYAYQLGTGRQLWRCELGGWVHASPAVAQQTVFVATVRLHQDHQPAFYWIDLASGRVRARRELPDSAYSSPVVWDDTVLIGCRDKSLYAFDRDARRTEPLWTFATNGYVHATPVVVGDTVLVASYDGWLYALRQAKPVAVWTRDDVVPRWFMAALVKQLHEEAGKLVQQAAAGNAGAPLTLTAFEPLLQQVRQQAAAAAPVTQVLPADVPAEHPGARYVAYTLAAGLLSGYPDGTFHPSDPASRYQLAAALGATLDTICRPDFAWRALRERSGGQVAVEVQIRPPAGSATAAPSDVDSKHWSYRALADMARRGLLPLDDENRFRGERQVSLSVAAEQWARLQAAVRVVRTK